MLRRGLARVVVVVFVFVVFRGAFGFGLFAFLVHLRGGGGSLDALDRAAARGLHGDLAPGRDHVIRGAGSVGTHGGESKVRGPGLLLELVPLGLPPEPALLLGNLKHGCVGGGDASHAHGVRLDLLLGSLRVVALLHLGILLDLGTLGTLGTLGGLSLGPGGLGRLSLCPGLRLRLLRLLLGGGASREHDRVPLRGRHPVLAVAGEVPDVLAQRLVHLELRALAVVQNVSNR